MAQLFLCYFGVCGQLDNLLTMDPLGQHVGDSTGPLLYVAESPFFKAERISPPRIWVYLPKSVFVCLSGHPSFRRDRLIHHRVRGIDFSDISFVPQEVRMHILFF